MSQALHLALEAYFGGDSAGLGVGFNVLLCLPSPMAASHPPLIPPGWEKYFQNLGDLGVFPKFQLPSFPNCVLAHSPVFCGLGDRQVLGVPLILQEFSSGKMLGGFPSPAPPLACSLPLLRVWVLLFGEMMVGFGGLRWKGRGAVWWPVMLHNHPLSPQDGGASLQQPLLLAASPHHAQPGRTPALGFWEEGG